MTRREKLERAYLAGFNASGEGWNGEYPFHDFNKNPAEDADWVSLRDEALSALIAQEPDAPMTPVAQRGMHE